MIGHHRIWIDQRPEGEGALLRAQALDSADRQIVHALATLLVEPRWKPALSRVEKLVDLTPGHAGPRQSVESIRRRLAAVPAPR